MSSKEVDQKLSRRITSINQSHAKDRKDEERPLIVPASKISLVAQYLSTGIEQVDRATGGGFAVGGITAIHGTHFTGKTAMCVQAAGVETRAGRNVLYVYTETPPPLSLFAQMNVDLDHLYLVGPQDYAEQMINAVEDILWDKDKRKPTGFVSMVIVDSINNFVGIKEVRKLDDDGAEGQNMAVRAQLIDNFLRRLMGRGLLEAGTAAVLIVQDRANMDKNSHVKQSMSGGFSIKYNPKIIINLRKKMLPGEKKYDGHTVIVDVTKNGVLGRPACTEYTVMYGQGVDDTEALVARGMEWGYVVPDGRGRGWYRIVLPTLDGLGDIQIKGKGNVGPVLRTLPEAKQILRDLLAAGKPKTPPALSESVRAVYETTEGELESSTGE